MAISGQDQKNHMPIFLDPTRRRARMVGWLATLTAGALAIWATFFWFSIHVLGSLPTGVDLIAVARQPDAGPAATVPEQPQCTGVPIAMTDALSPAAGLSVHAMVRVWPEGAVEKLAPYCGDLVSIMVESHRPDRSEGCTGQRSFDHGSDPVRLFARNRVAHDRAPAPASAAWRGSHA